MPTHSQTKAQTNTGTGKVSRLRNFGLFPHAKVEFDHQHDLMQSLNEMFESPHYILLGPFHRNFLLVFVRGCNVNLFILLLAIALA